MLRPGDFQRGRVRVARLDDDFLCISIAAPDGASAGSVDALATLTPAERAVSELVARGVSNRRIAELRGASLRTVANQLTAVYKKLGVASRRELRVRLSARHD